MLLERLREELNTGARLLQVTTNPKGLPALIKKARYWRKKGIKLNWFGLETLRCRLKRTNQVGVKAFVRGTLVKRQKTNSAQGTGLAKHGDNYMKVEEVLVKLEKHEAECNLRYKAIEERLEDHKSSLKSLDIKLWALAVLILIAPFVQKFLG